ncbi:thermonuclease family protein [Cytobacillus pseudoceanisediminis]|uniref:thermonuclease family protein n=1 Tax=Cytobacillus pseudoceanisediminis TaxID=3051614 RepID=UPI0034E208FE
MGKEIEIESDPNADITDKYGRYLIHAFISGKSIQQILILEGLVRVAYLYDEYNYTDLYLAAEKSKNSRPKYLEYPRVCR